MNLKLSRSDLLPEYREVKHPKYQEIEHSEIKLKHFNDVAKAIISIMIYLKVGKATFYESGRAIYKRIELDKDE